MKAVRLVDCIGPNPAYSKAAARAAKAAGNKYDVPRDMKYPAGTFSEHPDCWILCCLPEPKMAPVDDACKKKVDDYLNAPSRVAQLSRLKSLADLPKEKFEKLPKDLQTYVNVVSEKWLNPKLTDNTEDEPPTEDGENRDSPIGDDTLAFFNADKTEHSDSEE